MASGNPHPASAGSSHALLEPFLFLPALESRRLPDVLAEMLAPLESAGALRDTGALLRLLLDREASGSTSIGKGVAIPHARSLALASAHLVIGRSPAGVEWDAPDGEAVKLVFLLLAPDTPPWHRRYLDLLAQLAGILRLARNRARLLSAPSFEAAAAVLKELG